MINLNDILNKMNEIECIFQSFSKSKKEQNSLKAASNISVTQDSKIKPDNIHVLNKQKSALSVSTPNQPFSASTCNLSSASKNKNPSAVPKSEQKNIAYSHPPIIDLSVLWKEFNTLKQTWIALLNKQMLPVDAICELYTQSVILASSTQLIEDKLSILSPSQQYKYHNRRKLIQNILAVSKKLEKSAYSALKLKVTTVLYEASDDFFPKCERTKNIFYSQMPFAIQLKTEVILESSLNSALQLLRLDTRFKHPILRGMLAQTTDEIEHHSQTLMLYLKRIYDIYQICEETKTTVVNIFMQYNNPFVLLAGWQCEGFSLHRGVELFQHPPQTPAIPSIQSLRTYQLLNAFSKNNGFEDNNPSSDSAKKMVFEWRSLDLFMGANIFNLTTSKYQFASHWIRQNAEPAALMNSVVGHEIGKKILSIFMPIKTTVSVISVFLHVPLIKTKNVNHVLTVSQIYLAGKKCIYRITDVHGGEFETNAENLRSFLDKLFICFQYNSKNYQKTSLFILDSALKALLEKRDKTTQEVLMTFSKTFGIPSKDKPRLAAAPMKEARRNEIKHIKQTMEKTSMEFYSFPRTQTRNVFFSSLKKSDTPKSDTPIKHTTEHNEFKGEFMGLLKQKPKIQDIVPEASVKRNEGNKNEGKPEQSSEQSSEQSNSGHKKYPRKLT